MVGIDPPPSRRIVDRYGLFGILYGMGVLFVMAVVALCLLAAEAAKTVWTWVQERGET
jgi:hypothetical protein